MLKFIGVGDLFNKDLGNTSAYIKQNDTVLFLDCGTLTFQRILELDILEDVKNVFIAITHNHPDHIGGLASFIFYLIYNKNIKPTIIVPNEDESSQSGNLIDFLEIQGIPMSDFNIVEDKQVKIFENLTSFSYVFINHCENLDSFAIELQFDDRKVYYVGDNNDENYLRMILNKLEENDLIYTDCSLVGYNVHISLKDLANIFPDEKRKQVYCMHFADYQNIEEAKRLGFNIAEKEYSKAEYLQRIMSH